MAIDFTDFGLLGNGNGFSIAKKTINTALPSVTSITEDISGGILQKTYDINSVFTSGMNSNNSVGSAFTADSYTTNSGSTQTEIVDTASNIIPTYDTASEQVAQATGISNSNIVSEPIIETDKIIKTQLSDEEMNNAVIEANIRDQYDVDKPAKIDDNNDRMNAAINADVAAQFEPNPEKKEPSTEDVKDAIRKDGVSADTTSDYRVKLSAPVGKEEDIYGSKSHSNILKLLHDTNGILFHYTPTITEVHNLEYKSLSMVSSNQEYYTYTNTSAPTISISGSFVVQNVIHAKYCLAVIHFLRTITKSHFGKKDLVKAGSPPPIMELSGYGRYMYNRLPVIVRSHTFTFSDDVDYIEVTDAYGSITKIPMEFNITLDLVVQNTPRRWREEFNLDSFRTGELMRKQTGWL